MPGWIVFAILLTITKAADIELLECDPPDLPRRGGYGPVQDFYMPGDTVHYFCDETTYIGGNYLRRCLDTGDWTGDTPVCDRAATFTTVKQSSTADERGIAEHAIDKQRNTCSSTQGGQSDQWAGTFAKPGELIRVKIFLPKGPVSFEVILLKSDGEEVVCGKQTINIDSYDWTFQNCPGPNNRNATGLKIKSLTNAPLQICEIQATVLTSPKCVDPHERIDGGRLRMDRRTAVLVCDEGFTRGPDTSLQCIREGVWNKKHLTCN